MSEVLDVLKITTPLNIFPQNIKKDRDLIRNVSNAWFTFSSFIPHFLNTITEKISNSTINQRIKKIINEEQGEGNELMKHSRLFYLSNLDSGIKAKLIELNSIKKLKNKFKEKVEIYDAEAFSVGVSFGLEIIAEENINYLLENCSINETDREKLEESLFYKIHLVNEADHIRLCFENYKIVASNEFRKESFAAGKELGLQFWKEFWLEAIHE